MNNARAMLADGLAALNLPATDVQIDQLLAFIALIEKWNKAYNLTAIRNREEMVRLHLLDSLAIVPFIEGQRVIDIGTGAGLPGIPLAIFLPDTQFTLLDSNAKKTRFVQQVILELKLGNVSVQHQRVEAFQPAQGFDRVLTRAFASLADIIKLTRHLLAQDGALLAMKSQQLETELAELGALATTAEIIPITLPDTDVQRCLVKIQLPTEERLWEK
ncbi:16S rRNA (guanine(527)-N(7))-methyltransferase RsmG [Methylosoma difficile]